MGAHTTGAGPGDAWAEANSKPANIKKAGANPRISRDSRFMVGSPSLVWRITSAPLRIDVGVNPETGQKFLSLTAQGRARGG
jgi:hypothetical protein